MLRHFEDREAGGFFFTSDDHEQLILRPKTFGDDATPAGNGVAARLLVRLGFLLAEPRYLDGSRAHASRRVGGAREVPPWPHDARHGARRADRSARRRRAARRHRRAGCLAGGARPGLRPSPPGAGYPRRRDRPPLRSRRQAAPGKFGSEAASPRMYAAACSARHRFRPCRRSSRNCASARPARNESWLHRARQHRRADGATAAATGIRAHRA